MTIQSFTDAKLILETHFKKEWNDNTRIMFPNTQQQIRKKGEKDKRFVRFAIINNDGRTSSFGGKSARYLGLVNVAIFVLKGTGSVEGHKLADIALRIFDRLQLQEIQFRTGNIVEVGEFDEFFQINVNIPFYRNLLC